MLHRLLIDPTLAMNIQVVQMSTLKITMKIILILISTEMTMELVTLKITVEMTQIIIPMKMKMKLIQVLIHLKDKILQDKISDKKYQSVLKYIVTKHSVIKTV